MSQPSAKTAPKQTPQEAKEKEAASATTTKAKDPSSAPAEKTATSSPAQQSAAAATLQQEQLTGIKRTAAAAAAGAVKIPPPGSPHVITAAGVPLMLPPKKLKRPYRRTKRPKNYNDKSTITTTTASVTQQNAYDAVLAESQDLWQAAAEAQQLGRLKSASAYMLLLHARLVGLGKRFDKAAEHRQQQQGATSHEKMPPPVATPGHGPMHPPGTAFPATTTTASAPTPNTQAARKLTKMLPSDIELDTAMMEHLAKAAAELHAARSGSRKQQQQQQQRSGGAELLASPDAREFLLQTANIQGVTNATTMGVAWTRREIDTMTGGLVAGRSAHEIALQMGRTEQQVKSFIRNRNERARIAADALDLLPAAAAAAPGGNSGANNNNNNNNSGTGGAAAAADGDSSPKRKGGRGRKPATTAMTTVPNANCDAKALLQGGFLEQQQQQQHQPQQQHGDEEEEEEQEQEEQQVGNESL